MKEIGAIYRGDGVCDFYVWAPFLQELALRIVSDKEQLIPMEKDEKGYWHVRVKDIAPGTRYLYRINNEKDRPDPASFFQPEGVHGPSEVVDHGAFKWEDTEWQGIGLKDMIIYEVHIGTLTSEGTFYSAIDILNEIKDTGINTIELMPVCQFPGSRNWGYDGVYPYAVQNSYGGPEGLKRFVNECHKRGMAVILDVVYNHLGPEGNYLRDYGPYFTDKYKTPWGEALNFDGPYSNEVREFFLNNAIYWMKYYHIDGLRLDAIHGIFDMSARHFLRELSERVEEFSRLSGRKYYLMAESDLNNPIVATPRSKNGYGIDAVWCDDFHHAIHAVLTGEREGYYVDFGSLDQIVVSLREGYVFKGQYSKYRKKNHGMPSASLRPDQFIVFSQNHDQVGNRLNGDRLSSLISFEALKLTAAAVILSPYIPLIFMGEEYGETAPFLYFVSHSDQWLIDAVREGRKREFESFRWKQDPPDPQSEDTFMRSKLNWSLRKQGRNRILLEFYRKIIRIRGEFPSLACLKRGKQEVFERDGIIFLKREAETEETLSVFNFSKSDVSTSFEIGEGYTKIIDSAGSEWDGPGSLMPDVVDSRIDIKIRAESFQLFRIERG